jgi:hypothetical protein
LGDLRDLFFVLIFLFFFEKQVFFDCGGVFRGKTWVEFLPVKKGFEQIVDVFFVQQMHYYCLGF